MPTAAQRRRRQRAGNVVESRRQPPVSGIDRALAVGDSLTVGSSPALQSALERRGVKVRTDARVGRPSTEAVGVLEQQLRPGTDAVVFDVGTNDASEDVLRGSVKRARRIAGDRPIYMGTVNGPDAADKNALLRRFAAKDKIELVNWAGRSRRQGLLGGDGIHATPDGYAARGRTFARAVARGVSPVAAAGAAGVAPGSPRGRGVVASAARARGGGTPGEKKLPDSVYDAINRAVTPRFGRWARKNYGVGGKRLLALVAAGEGGGSIDEGTSNTSYADAKGPFQFIPDTRRGYIDQYGIDAWKSDYDAARAAIIHLMGTGVAGYNPGMPSYTDYILNQSVDTRPLVTGGRGGRMRVGGGNPAGGGRPPSISRGGVEPGGTGIASMLSALMEQNAPQAPPSMGVAAPAHSAAPPLPAGYQPIESGPPAPEPEQDLSSLLGLVGPGTDVPHSEVRPGVVGGGGGGGSISDLAYGPSGGAAPELVGQPLDRPGVSTRPHVLNSVRAISSILGSPIQLGTGTAHSQYTTSGNVSDHWGGDAIDLPARGKRLIAMGRSALIAAGMPAKQARKAGAGLYNINGWQIIFGTNSAALGGDHTDHVHVKSPRGYKFKG